MVTIKIGGPAGSGVMTVGTTIAKILKKSGLYVYTCTDHPSLIKGGHNQVMVYAENHKINSNIYRLDILVAIDETTITKHAQSIREGGALIYDSGAVKNLNIDRKDIHIVPVHLKGLAEEVGNKIYANTVALGAICGLLNTDEEITTNILKSTFQKKGDEIVKQNIEALKKGFDIAREKEFDTKVEKQEDNNRIMIDGNTALSYGAIKAGCKFISAYPMTPATSIMQTLAKNEMDYNIVVKQTEDEIAAVNMAIGAAFTGVRAMTATSGGGFALMSEALGMAALAEVPLVMVEVQRGGPSTGIPTYTAQDDLRFVMHASQGEFPRIVIAPGDAEECFYEGFNAFNLAEIYQTPVILVSDKELASAKTTIEKFNTDNLKINRGKLMSDEDMKSSVDFKRHLLTEDGISPRSVPGQPNGLHVGSSYEHDETGFTSEGAQNHIDHMDKRARKLDHIFDFVKGIEVYGEDEFDVQLIIWGSTKGACVDALPELEELGIKARIIQVKYVLPFPTQQFGDILDNDKPILILEHNKSGQLRGVIRENTGILLENFYGKYDSRPIYPEDVVEQVRKLLNK